MVPPPQAPATPLGVEIIKPTGNVSLNATPLNAVAEFALLTVKLSEVMPFKGTLAAPNDLMMTGGATTITDALEVFPVPASVEVMVTELFFIPAVVPVTPKETVHVVLGARVAAVRLACEAPATAAAIPPQALLRLGGVDTTNPAGRVSANDKPVRVIAFAPGFPMVNVKDVVPFRGIVAAPNTLTMVGGVATDRLAEAVFPVPPFAELTFPVVLV